MMEVIPFEPWHMQTLEAQGTQAYLSEWLSVDDMAALKNEQSFTGVLGGRPLICSGIIQQWEGRALAWAYLACDVAPHFIHIHRAVKRFLDMCPVRRIEAMIDVDFEAAHRWAKMLGFEMEAARMRKVIPFGNDCALYAKVRD